MIDFVIVFQALLAAATLWCAAQEKLPWDRAGFSFLTAAAAVMTIRRVTARVDDYYMADKVLLPTLITCIFACAVCCFVVERVIRVVQNKKAEQTAIRRLFWPFLFCFLATSLDSLPAQTGYVGFTIFDTPTDVLRRDARTLCTPESIEALRFESGLNIDVLALIASGEGKLATMAKEKLASLHRRLEKFQ